MNGDTVAITVAAVAAISGALVLARWRRDVMRELRRIRRILERWGRSE